jgi:hypothetical protein
VGRVPGALPEYPKAHLQHERAKNELKNLMPDDAKEAIGHGVRARGIERLWWHRYAAGASV